MSAIKPTILAAIGLAIVLAGCSAGPVLDQLPADMGLPAGTPARPAVPYEYPAVHDMPPPRAAKPMTEEEQLKVEEDLTAVRNRQEGRPAPDKKLAPAVKKKPADANNDQDDGDKDGAKAGTKTNP